MTTHRADDISPHTRNALKRIGTGWRINCAANPAYWRWPWEVYNDKCGDCFLFRTPDEAKAEYLRLTSEASKGDAL